MCKALCRLKIFSLSAQVVFLPRVQSFSLCVEIPLLIEFIVADGTESSAQLPEAGCQGLIHGASSCRIQRAPDAQHTVGWGWGWVFSLLLASTLESTGCGPAGDASSFHWLWQQGNIHHQFWVCDSEQQTWTEKERKTWVVLAQVCVHISVFGGGTGGH